MNTPIFKAVSNLVFKNNEANEPEGLGHSGIETYADTPCSSVARECGQNSADAVSKWPIKLSFKLLEIQKSEFPSLNEFKSAINACSKAAIKEKEVDFFDRAKRIINSDTIKVLEISDFNTNGAKEEFFNALVKGKGVNIKERVDSGGSFGIGKYAAFAVSDLQTVFYSTLYFDDKDKGVEKFLAQGKSILTSHTDEQGKPKEATGYWGQSNYKPIKKPENVPKWMRREKVGTSIFAVGFSQNDWQSLMKASVAANFFAAIHRGEMIFEIDSEIIDKDNISEVFQDEELLDKIEGGYLEESFNFSRSLYQCLTSTDTITNQINVDNIGRVSISLLQNKNLPKRIGIIRNGMYITDNFKNFGEPLSNFPNQEDFVAIIEPLDTDGSTLIKKLENPKHNGFSAERIKDPEKKKVSKKAIKDLVNKAREKIREDTYIDAEESIELEEMKEFFPRSSDEDDLRDPNADEDDLRTVKFKAGKPRNTTGIKTTNTQEEGEEGGASNSGQGSGGSGGGNGDGRGKGSGGNGNYNNSNPVVLRELRNLIPEYKSAYFRDIFFTPDHSGIISLSVFASGIDGEVEIGITEIEGSRVSNKNALALVEAGKRNKISIKFKELYDGPIKVLAQKEIEKEKE